MAKKPKKEEMVAVATELNGLLKPDPPIDTEAKPAAMLSQIKKAAGLLEPGDEISKETAAFLKAQSIEHKATEKAAKPKKTTKPKEKAAPKAKKPGKERNKHGHAIGSQAAAIDEALEGKGGTLDELAKATGFKKARIKSHIKHLIEKKKVKVKEDKNGKFSI